MSKNKFRVGIEVGGTHTNISYILVIHPLECYVGVLVQQLNKLKVAKVMGSLPENVNFGIKASTVRQFLTSAGLPTKWSNRSKRRSNIDLAKIAKNQTVMVVCNP